MPDQTITKLTKLASFSVEDSATADKKRISFFYDAPKGQHDKLLVLCLPLDGSDYFEQELKYNEELSRWEGSCEVPDNLWANFEFKPSSPADSLDERISATVLQKGYIALKDGEQQAVNEGPHVPKGELKNMLYTKDGEIKPAVEQSNLKEGERLVKVYLPPGYDPTRQPPYNFQVTLDGGQYLDSMNMHHVYDNLIANGDIEPVVNVFIAPYTGPPNPGSEPEYSGMGTLCPKGYSLEQRHKEYSANPIFADQLAKLPEAMREAGINVTDQPECSAIWGTSKSGLQATYTALLHPGVFGNVVAQSPEAWNPKGAENEGWRDRITSDYTTAKADYPENEHHNEHLLQMVTSGRDSITGRPLDLSKRLSVHFDAGEAEKQYNPDPKVGDANLVKAAELLAGKLSEKGHRVDGVYVTPGGGHHPMTWMAHIADAAKQMHIPATPLHALDRHQKPGLPIPKSGVITAVDNLRDAFANAQRQGSAPEGLPEPKKPDDPPTKPRRGHG